MKCKILIIPIVWFACLASAQEKPCVLISVSGNTEVRGENELNWEPAQNGRIFKERETIRTAGAATARIQTSEGEVFVLSNDAQIEARDLRKLGRDEVVMELTAMALQHLPSGKDTASFREKPSAFILHGNLPENRESQASKESQSYLKNEERGALALFEQSYFAGFILKWNRLLNAFPEFASEPVEAALIQAYDKMGMPLRKQQALERFKQRWPNSTLLPQ